MNFVAFSCVTAADGIIVVIVAELLLVMELVVLLFVVVADETLSSNDFSNDAIGAAPRRFCLRASMLAANGVLGTFSL